LKKVDGMSQENKLSTLKQKYDVKLICITPFRDEQWMLHRFLSCALLWADMVILGDHNSTQPYEDILDQHDRSRIRVVPVEMEGFNESALRNPLLQAAREIPGKKLLVFLDADEVLSANFLSSPELHTILTAAEGTYIYTDWFQLNNNMLSGYNMPFDLALIFMDDGISGYNMNRQFHGFRVPGDANEHIWNVINLHDINVVHYGPANLYREKLKKYWYQCQEWLLENRKTTTQILRQYSLDPITLSDRDDQQQLPPAYFSSYLEAGIDMSSIATPSYNWQEKQVLDSFSQYGPAHFDLLDIWHHNWLRASVKYGNENPVLLNPKRSFRGRLLRWYIRFTANNHGHPVVKKIDGWVDHFF